MQYPIGRPAKHLPMFRLICACAGVLWAFAACGDDGGPTAPATPVEADSASGEADSDPAADDARVDADAAPDPDAPDGDDDTPEGGDPADSDAAPTQTCCETSDEPGCTDEGISACVCKELPGCCKDAWTPTCVDAATVLCQAGCGTASGGCGDGVCTAAEDCEGCPADCGFCSGDGDCCTPHRSPGCDALDITNCICAFDPYCCQVEWDETCIEAVSECGGACSQQGGCGDGRCASNETCAECPGDCGRCPALGSCCEVHETPGCADELVRDCVCAQLPGCCSTTWDTGCAFLANLGCGGCDAPMGGECGDGVCNDGEGCESCPVDCGICEGAGDCCSAHVGAGCSEPSIEECVCAIDEECCEDDWFPSCSAVAEVCGAPCSEICGCPWMETGACGPVGAVLEVVPLDIWARPLPTATAFVTPEGGTDPLEGESGAFLWTLGLCGATSLELEVVAPDHDSASFVLNYDGTGGALAVELGGDFDSTAWVLQTDVRDVGGVLLRHYTAYIGLAHHWYAPSGLPPRPGNDVELLHDGEEAWATVWADLQLATDRVAASSWWWTSELELVRDPSTHIWLPEAERWQNTLLGTLEAAVGVTRRVLVNQFYSQDGLLSSITIDDALEAKATAPGDDFEFMGMANEVHGAFTVVPQPVSLAARLADNTDSLVVSGAATVGAVPFPPVSEPIAVDMGELPLGLGALQVPLASWHQKFIVIDGDVAITGGMNFKTTDWDSSEHEVFGYRRMAFDASAAEREEVLVKATLPDFDPRKDYMVRVEGPVASDIEGVFSTRWNYQLAAGVQYAELSTPAPAPEPADELPGGVEAQLVLTMPPPFEDHSILDTLLRAVSRAETYILIEDQFFRAPVLYDAIVDRMLERPELDLLVVTNPVNEWVDPGCWQSAIAHELFQSLFPQRFRMFYTASFDAVDTDCTFCIDETEATFATHLNHSKVVLIDDHYLEVGSANNNNRSLLYEGEMAVVIANDEVATEARHTILSGLLGADYDPTVPPWELLDHMDASAELNEAVRQAWDDEGMDLDLDGEPLPPAYIPEGFLYPLELGPPDDCLLEGIGPDVA